MQSHLIGIFPVRILKCAIKCRTNKINYFSFQFGNKKNVFGWICQKQFLEVRNVNIWTAFALMSNINTSCHYFFYSFVDRVYALRAAIPHFRAGMQRWNGIEKWMGATIATEVLFWLIAKCANDKWNIYTQTFSKVCRRVLFGMQKPMLFVSQMPITASVNKSFCIG